MENIKYIRSSEERGLTKLYFKICDNLADFIRKNTNYRKEDLQKYYLDENNLFIYSINASTDSDSVLAFIAIIERISNEGDDAYLYNHILTNNGCRRFPSEIHSLMHEEYGLVDINEEDNNPEDSDLEWWTAHFFIALSGMIFDRPTYSKNYCEEDNEVEETREIPSLSEVSDILSMLKSIDNIVVVDDARKVDFSGIDRFNK